MISIIIPAYNAGESIERCILSAMNQSYENIEIIIVNDGSVDNTLEICKKKQLSDSRIVIVSQKNRGVSCARNAGLKISRGKYVQFLDSDDYLHQNFCEEMVGAIKKNNTELVMCGLHVKKENATLRTPNLGNRQFQLDNDDHFISLLKLLASPCNKLYIRDKISFEFNNDLKFGEDFDFNLKYLSKISNVTSIDSPLYIVNLDNDKSLNRTFQLDRLDKYIISQKKLLEYSIERYGYSDKVSGEINKNIVKSCHAHFRNMVSEGYNFNFTVKYIKKYYKKPNILFSAKNSKFVRKDYEFFRYLVLFNMSVLTYIFLKMKVSLHNLKISKKMSVK